MNTKAFIRCLHPVIISIAVAVASFFCMRHGSRAWDFSPILSDAIIVSAFAVFLSFFFWIGMATNADSGTVKKLIDAGRGTEFWSIVKMAIRHPAYLVVLCMYFKMMGPGHRFSIIDSTAFIYFFLAAVLSCRASWMMCAEVIKDEAGISKR
jgi:predicted neutral ceramidase superfamily lipid hydrolase